MWSCGTTIAGRRAEIRSWIGNHAGSMANASSVLDLHHTSVVSSNSSATAKTSVPVSWLRSEYVLPPQENPSTLSTKMHPEMICVHERPQLTNASSARSDVRSERLMNCKALLLSRGGLDIRCRGTDEKRAKRWRTTCDA